MEATTPLWLSHHPAGEDLGRCVAIKGRLVCRRCLVLYPVAFLVMALSLAGVHWPASWDGWLLIALPIPGVIEFVLEQWSVVPYDPRRMMLVTVPLAVALGQGFARYLHAPGDPLFWSIVVGYGVICGLSVIRRWARAT